MSNIGEQIKKYRIEKGITQEQLGNLIGVTTQAVSRWERGGTPDAEVIPAISDVLGVSTDALFGREQQSFALSLARQLSSMPQEKAFQYAFSISGHFFHVVFIKHDLGLRSFRFHRKPHLHKLRGELYSGNGSFKIVAERCDKLTFLLLQFQLAFL